MSFEIENGVLKKYTGTDTEPVIPDGVTEIGSNAFTGCTGLTSITIPNSVTEIGDAAFYDCTKLASITLSDSVTVIGDQTFACCTGLTSINIPHSVTKIGVAAFCYSTELASITLSDSVTVIEDETFAGCKGLTSINIPHSVTKICDLAFDGCVGLTSITIPHSVAEIGCEAFSGCVGLTSITIPHSVTKIGGGAFCGCTELASVTLSDSVTVIEDETFAGCKGLTSINIPHSVTKIEGAAFCGCTGLTSITIPNSVTNMDFGDDSYTGDSFFSFGDNTTLIFENPAAGYYRDYGLVYNYYESDGVTFGEKHGYGLTLLSCDSSKIGEYAVPDGVKTIFPLAFENCKKLTKIVLSESVKNIGECAFMNCAKLDEIKLPKGLEKIDAGAFIGCKALTSLYVPLRITDAEKTTFPNRAEFTLYVDLGSPVYAFAKKRWNKITLKYTVDPEQDYSGKVKIDMLKLIVTANDVASLAILLQYYKRMDKYIDELITLSSKEKNTEMLAFLMNWKNDNVNVKKKNAVKEKRMMRELLTDTPKKVTAAELKKLWVVRDNGDGTLAICGYKGEETSVEVPKTVGTKTVTAIDGSKLIEEAGSFNHRAVIEWRGNDYGWLGKYEQFGKNVVVTRVVIPASVTSFGEGVFEESEGLTIAAPKDSAAHKFAVEHNITFEEA